MSNFVAIDFETANDDGDSACAVAVVACRNGKIAGAWSSRIRPPTPIFIHTRIHGIRWKDVREAPAFDALWPTLAGWLRDVDFVAAHNASFDSGVLAACCRRYGLQPPRIPFECTVKMARAQWRIRPTKLPDVCRRLGIPLRHHDPESDAEACARIVLAAERAGWRPQVPPAPAPPPQESAAAATGIPRSSAGRRSRSSPGSRAR